jgi:hypothetical protein
MFKTSKFQSLLISLLGGAVALIIYGAPWYGYSTIATQTPTPFDLEVKSSTSKYVFAFLGEGAIDTDTVNWNIILQTLRSKGFQFTSERSIRYSDEIEFATILNTECQSPSCTVQVSALFQTSNELLIYKVTNYDVRFTNQLFDLSIWESITPFKIITELNVPESVYVYYAIVGNGYLMKITLAWPTKGFAIEYSLSGKSLSQTVSQFCINSTSILRASEYAVPQNTTIYRPLLRKWDEAGMAIKPFSSGMFLGINTIGEFARAIKAGKCLEMPIAIWYPEVPYSTPSIIVQGTPQRFVTPPQDNSGRAD